MPIDPKNLSLFFKTNSWRFNKCLDPSMTCESKAIRAHSIQNARVIDLLEHDGHVVTPRLKVIKTEPSIEFDLVGRNEASTFTGLCGEHDAKLFALIDKQEVDLANPEQLFLLAYRSVTRELHAVMQGAGRLQSAYLSRVKRGLDPRDAPSGSGLIATQHLMKAFLTYQYRAKHFDRALDRLQFDAIAHDVIWLNEQSPCLAVSSLFSLDELWDAADDDIVRVVLNVFPLDERRTWRFSHTRVGNEEKPGAHWWNFLRHRSLYRDIDFEIDPWKRRVYS